MLPGFASSYSSCQYDRDLQCPPSMALAPCRSMASRAARLRPRLPWADGPSRPTSCRLSTGSRRCMSTTLTTLVRTRPHDLRPGGATSEWFSTADQIPYSKRSLQDPPPQPEAMERPHNRPAVQPRRLRQRWLVARLAHTGSNGRGPREGGAARLGGLVEREDRRARAAQYKTKGRPHRAPDRAV